MKKKISIKVIPQTFNVNHVVQEKGIYKLNMNFVRKTRDNT